jgi:hypothetical protein
VFWWRGLTGDFNFPFLESALGFTFAGSILFCVLFYFYCGIVCLERVTAYLSHRFKHPPNTTLEPTPTALELMDGLSYTTVIGLAEPLALRRGSALDR